MRHRCGGVLRIPRKGKVRASGIGHGHLADGFREQSLRQQRHFTGRVAHDFPHRNLSVTVDVGLAAHPLKQQESQSTVWNRQQFGSVLVGPRSREDMNSAHTRDAAQGFAPDGIVECAALHGLHHGAGPAGIKDQEYFVAGIEVRKRISSRLGIPHCAQKRRRRHLHGRQGPLHGQHLHRAPLALAQIRGRLPARARRRLRRPEGHCQVAQLL